MKHIISSWLAFALALSSLAFGGDKEFYVDVVNQAGDCKKLSRLVMGTDHLAQSDWTKNGQAQMTEEEIFKVLDEAARLGINFFDTAPIYIGGIEHTLGKWMRSRKEMIRADQFYHSDKADNPDRKLYALSKGGFPFDLYHGRKLERGEHSEELKDVLRKTAIMGADVKTGHDGSYALGIPPGSYASRLYGGKYLIEERITEELGGSIKNLGENLTVYLMHRDDGDYFRFKPVPRKQTPVSTIMEALSAEAISKNFWLLGWSNWTTERVNKSIALAKSDESLTRPGLNSPYFSLFEMEKDRPIHAGGIQVTHEEMMNPDFQKGIKIMPYSPLGGFSILDQEEPTWKNAMEFAKGKYEKDDPYWQNVYPALFTPANKARFERAVAFTKKFNKKHKTHYTVDQMVNAYALAHVRTDFLAVGAITVEQVGRTVSSLKLASLLTDENLEYLYSGTSGTKEAVHPSDNSKTGRVLRIRSECPGVQSVSTVTSDVVVTSRLLTSVRESSIGVLFPPTAGQSHQTGYDWENSGDKQIAPLDLTWNENSCRLWPDYDSHSKTVMIASRKGR